VMARSADISEQSYDQLVSFVDSLGYDTAKLVRAPHQIKAE